MQLRDGRGFESVGVPGFLAALGSLPSLSRHLEHEIGLRMHRGNVNLETFGATEDTALGWLIDACLRTFTPIEMSIWSRDQDGNLRVAAFRPPTGTASGLSTLRLGGPLSEVVRHRAGVRFADDSGRATAMITPILLGHRLLGVIHVRSETRPFDEDDLDTFSLITEVFTLGCFMALQDGSFASAEPDRSEDARKAA